SAQSQRRSHLQSFVPGGTDLEIASAGPMKLDLLLVHFARQVHGPVDPDQPLAFQTAIPLPGQGGRAHSHSKSPLREFSARNYQSITVLDKCAQRTVCCSSRYSIPVIATSLRGIVLPPTMSVNTEVLLDFWCPNRFLSD